MNSLVIALFLGSVSSTVIPLKTESSEIVKDINNKMILNNYNDNEYYIEV